MMADTPETPTPAEQVARLYEQAEAEAARASERLVGSRGFAGLLGQMAENAAALTRLSADALDLMLRNLRVAGRRDIVRLARQLGRTEDKLERVLQEVEELRDELRQARADADAAASPAGATPAGATPAGASPASTPSPARPARGGRAAASGGSIRAPRPAQPAGSGTTRRSTRSNGSGGAPQRRSAS